MDKSDEKGLESLAVWKKAMDFAVWVHKTVLPCLPIDEKYVLASQVKRASQNIPANIAEGHGRFYYQDGVRFCYVARGSLEETRSHLILANRFGYLPDPTLLEARRMIEEIRRLLNGYITYLKQTRQGSSEPGSAIHEAVADYETEDPSLVDPSPVVSESETPLPVDPSLVD
jgi:four helix bundle protein